MLNQLFFLLLVHYAYTANILIVGVTVSHSHHFWIEAVAMGLVDKGHNITYLSNDPTKIKHDNYTVITLDGAYERFNPASESSNFLEYLTTMSLTNSFDFMWDTFLQLCKFTIKHQQLHKVLAYPKDHFQLILWDNAMGECLYPLIDHFGNPLTIGLSPFGLTDSINHIYKGHVFPYVGQVTMPFAEAITLQERILNTGYTMYNQYRRENYYKPESVKISQQVFPKWNKNKFERIEDNFNLVLLNWNVAVNQLQPLAPNMIPIGGVQIKTNEVLQKSLKDIFDKASDGIIYFSMGSNFQSEDLPAGTIQSIVQCFAELKKYEIIWKIEPPKHVEFTSNVNTVIFAPQTAILAHHKTRLFITHGGGLSTQETSYFGVLILGIPLFLDQINNIHKLMLRGGGELLTLQEMKMASSNDNIFCRKVKKVLQDDSYKVVMTNISKRYQDREVHPLDTAIYWVEYILRHGDAKHLRSLSHNMSAFYSQNMDMYLLVFISLSVVTSIVFIVIGFCCRSFRIVITNKKKMN